MNRQSAQPSTSRGQPSTSHGQPSTSHGQPSTTSGQVNNKFGRPSVLRVEACVRSSDEIENVLRRTTPGGKEKVERAKALRDELIHREEIKRRLTPGGKEKFKQAQEKTAAFRESYGRTNRSLAAKKVQQDHNRAQQILRRKEKTDEERQQLREKARTKFYAEKPNGDGSWIDNPNMEEAVESFNDLITDEDLNRINFEEVLEGMEVEDISDNPRDNNAVRRRNQLKRDRRQLQEGSGVKIRNLIEPSFSVDLVSENEPRTMKKFGSTLYRGQYEVFTTSKI